MRPSPRLTTPILALLLAVCAACPAAADPQVLGDNFDAIIERQGAAVDAAYLGGQAFLERGAVSVGASVFLGGDDVFHSGAAYFIQTCRYPVEAGISYAEMEADFKTRMVAINVQHRIITGRRGALMLQLAGAHQWLRDNQSGVFALRFSGDTGDSFAENPYTLVQEASWSHLLGQAAARFDLGFLHPVMNLGFKSTDFHISGLELDDDMTTVMDKSERNGVRWSVHYGAGLEIEVLPVRASVGMVRVDHGDLYFQGGMTLVF